MQDTRVNVVVVVILVAVDVTVLVYRYMKDFKKRGVRAGNDNRFS